MLLRNFALDFCFLHLFHCLSEHFDQVLVMYQLNCMEVSANRQLNKETCLDEF